VFREVLDSVPAYRSALEWAFHQKLDSVTNVDIAAHWQDHHPDATGTDNENTIKDQAVCFFRLCEGAELGQMVSGRRGQPTRLNFNKSELSAYIEAGPSELPWVEPPAPIEQPQPDGAKPEVAPPSPDTPESAESVTKEKPIEQLRAFISHGKNTAIIERSKRCSGLLTFQVKSR